MSEDRQPAPGPGGGGQQQVPTWYVFLWMAALLMLVSYWTQFTPEDGVQSIAYSEFKEAVVAGEVAEVTLRGEEVRGRFTERGARTRGGEQAVERFRTIRPELEDRALLDLLEEHAVTIRAESQQLAWWQQLIINVLPWLLLLAFFFWLWYFAQRRVMGGGAGGMFQFGRSKARRFREEHPSVTMDDVAGVETAKRDLREIVDFLKHPGKYQALGAKMPKGVLMVGPPGTGKTLLARAVAGEAGVPFYSISGSEFIEMFVGVGAARVRDMFQNARSEAPSLIFIDELDSIGRARGTGLGGGHDEREQTLNQILAEMDGFEPHEKVVVLAATNRPDVLDAALLRPGRFDRKVMLERPHKEARKAILEVHARNVPLAEDVDLGHLAERTTGFSGADLENLINEAALIAARQGREEVDAEILDTARDNLVLGERRDYTLSDEEKRMVAYHECGHALTAFYLTHTDPLEKVTVVPRGRALGLTEQTPREERYNLNESYLRDRISVMLGGRVSERLVFGEVSSGAQQDLKEATQLARRMVAQWGMSEKVGPVGLNVGEEHVFLGREMAQPRDHSERLAELVDEEVRRVLQEAERRTEELLTEHRDGLDRLATAVLERETLDADEIGEVLESAGDAGVAARGR
ncbi:ATP-dependent zinc metalloprotease FtsH [Arhodomonas sp. SL1]|uniref:ATP-dependent zinc metalloprotease FtsH n=1 Tax=Arhodomonas sp. SL1 TaxID=3425691 RepID=UPI003F880449